MQRNCLPSLRFACFPCQSLHQLQLVKLITQAFLAQHGCFGHSKAPGRTGPDLHLPPGHSAVPRAHRGPLEKSFFSTCSRRGLGHLRPSPGHVASACFPRILSRCGDVCATTLELYLVARGPSIFWKEGGSSSCRDRGWSEKKKLAPAPQTNVRADCGKSLPFTFRVTPPKHSSLPLKPASTLPSTTPYNGWIFLSCECTGTTEYDSERPHRSARLDVSAAS